MTSYEVDAQQKQMNDFVRIHKISFISGENNFNNADLILPSITLCAQDPKNEWSMYEKLSKKN